MTLADGDKDEGGLRSLLIAGQDGSPLPGGAG